MYLKYINSGNNCSVYNKKISHYKIADFYVSVNVKNVKA